MYFLLNSVLLTILANEETAIIAKLALDAPRSHVEKHCIGIVVYSTV
jgi:hypothetical protein